MMLIAWFAIAFIGWLCFAVAEGSALKTRGSTLLQWTGFFLMILSLTCLISQGFEETQVIQRKQDQQAAHEQACVSACQAKGYAVRSFNTLCVCDTSTLVVTP